MPDPAIPSTDLNGAYPPAMREKETKAIRERRVVAGETGEELERPEVGLALSGGGIRSATFCLGLLQALAREKLLRKVDILSTISGGGYIGGFLGRFFTRKSDDTGKPQVDQVMESLGDSNSAPVRWLRENGRYLSPNGAGDSLLAGTVFFRNWATLQFTLGLFLVFIFTSLNLLRFSVLPSLATPGMMSLADAFSRLASAEDGLWWSPWMAVPLLVLGLWILPSAWAYWSTQFAPRGMAFFTGLLPVVASVVGIGAGAWLLARGWGRSADETTLPVLRRVGEMSLPGAAIVLTGLVNLVMWAIASRNAIRRNRDGNPILRSAARQADARNVLSTWMRNGFIVAIISVVVGLIDTFGQSFWALLAEHGKTSPLGAILSISGVSGGLALLLKFGDKIASLASRGGEKPSPWQVPLLRLVSISGYVVAFTVVVLWCTLGHAVAWGGGRPRDGVPGKHLVQEVTHAKAAVELTDASLIKVNPPTKDAEPAGGGTTVVNKEPSVDVMIFVWVLSMVLSTCIGFGRQFLNLSSLQQFYGSRLARAYIGATNPNNDRRSVTKPDSQDDIPFVQYHPERSGGPLHIIGTTLNETVSGKSQIQDRDRKGMVFAAGPCGVSAGITDHALWAESQKDVPPGRAKIEPIIPAGTSPDEYHKLNADADSGWNQQVEGLNLGNWVSVSGAAFSTGMGAQTQTGLSLLLAFANIRLGYHWDSRIHPWWRSGRILRGASKPPLRTRLWEGLITCCPVYAHLFYEATARFHGPNRRLWYLSDGGHFENTGCYELLRRRVPFIICCDCGADPDYVFEDVSNLVRKARIDFGAEIAFLQQDDIDEHVHDDIKPFIGTIADWQRKPDAEVDRKNDDASRYDGKAYSEKHATLAWVFYKGDKEAKTCILFIKPTLTGDEPLDVKNYHAQHADFPQETTLDQFFDEAQWESYRRLGAHIGGRLFKDKPGGKWRPAAFRSPTWKKDAPGANPAPPKPRVAAKKARKPEQK